MSKFVPSTKISARRSRGAAGADTMVGATAGVTVLAAKPPEPEPHSPAPYLWAMLIARVYEVFPLVGNRPPNA